MSPEHLERIGANDDVIVRLRAWIYGLLIAAAFLVITVYRWLGEI